MEQHVKLHVPDRFYQKMGRHLLDAFKEIKQQSDVGKRIKLPLMIVHPDEYDNGFADWLKKTGDEDILSDEKIWGKALMDDPIIPKKKIKSQTLSSQQETGIS